MKLLLIITIIITLIQVIRVSTCFLRKDASSIKKIFELLMDREKSGYRVK